MKSAMVYTLLVLSCIAGLCLGLPSPLKVAYVDTMVDCCEPQKTFIGMVEAGFNVVVLAFYQSATGPADAGITWSERLNDSTKAATIKQIHSMGGSVLISLGGANDQTWEKDDPVALGKLIGNWAAVNYLDGVDLDLEHFGGFDSVNASDNSTVKWFCELITTIKSVMGSNAIISMAPLAPWFGPIGMEQCTTAGQLNCSWVGPSGGMTAIDKACGKDIAYYFTQFYNQGTCYSTEAGLFTASGPGCTTKGAYYPYSSVKEIIDAGVPQSKIVIGKPVDARSAAGGYVDPGTLHDWVVDAGTNIGWTGGVGIWEWVDVFGSEAIPWIKAVYP